MWFYRIFSGAFLLSIAVSVCADADTRDAQFFDKNVRPLLTDRCWSCHGESKQKGQLRLDSRQAALEGGKSGTAIVPGKPAESPLVDAINYRGREMPPDGKLSDAEIETLTDWVKRGAPWAD